MARRISRPVWQNAHTRHLQRVLLHTIRVQLLRSENGRVRSTQKTTSFTRIAGL